jgi:hypothetical protein
MDGRHKQVLAEIMAWARGGGGGGDGDASGGDRLQPCIYWLNGMAGTGKSTIACTYCTETMKNAKTLTQEWTGW